MKLVKVTKMRVDEEIGRKQCDKFNKKRTRPANRLTKRGVRDVCMKVKREEQTHISSTEVTGLWKEHFESKTKRKQLKKLLYHV